MPTHSLNPHRLLSALLLMTLPAVALARTELTAHLELPALNEAALLQQDAASRAPGPVRYGIATEVAIDLTTAAKWEPLGNGLSELTWSVHAPGAHSLDLHFSEFWLPDGAELTVSDPAGAWKRGPFTDRHNVPSGVLPVPFVVGDRAEVRIVAPTSAVNYIRARLGHVSQAYRKLWNLAESLKSGACNVDVACPQSIGWENQIKAVAHYTAREGASSFVCTGQMINTTANDGQYFETANHCISSETVANSVTTYFNYESATCRAPGSAQSGQAISRNSFTDTISGATLIATYAPSDFTLLQLNQAPPESYDVFYTGWDRSGTALDNGAVAIHHPAGHAKRIAIANTALCKSPYLDNCNGAGSHWRVPLWDEGTTEGGSSGSGLWSPEGFLVGQLEGGFAACSGSSADDNDQPDWYGRIEVSWTGGGSAQSRLSDWLDPAGTNAVVQAGRGGCQAPQVTAVSNSGATFAVGDAVTFSSSVSGGQAPYSYFWDVDGDGFSDGDLASTQAIYHEAFSGNVVVQVTDATGCVGTDTVGVVVQSPQVVADSATSPAQVCGDNDSNLDPGEIWSYQVSLRNAGNLALGTSAASFGVSAASGAARLSGKLSGGPDAFGYTFADSQEATCSFDFADISASGSLLSFPNSGAGLIDDDVAIVNLGSSNFSFYGATISQLAVSSNGYLSTETNTGVETGGDFSNDCPLPSSPSTGSGARMYALHDDLLIDAAYHQFFASCPRPGDTAGGTGGCDIIQWDVAEFFDASGNIAADFDVQAVLYEGTDEIVFQYGPGNSRAGDSQTVGIQNGAANDALTYACNDAGAVAVNSSVCVFHPGAAPVKSDLLRLQEGAVTIATLGIGATTSVPVTVEIDEAINCGEQFSVDYRGTAFPTGFSNTPQANIITGQVAESCNVVTSCQDEPAPGLAPREGFIFNPLRPGNGIDIHFAGGVLYAAWYTANKERDPVWFYLQTVTTQQEFANDTVSMNVFTVQSPGDITQVAPTATAVGTAQLSFIDDSTAVLTWNISGDSSGEWLRFFDLTTDPVDTLLTDQYFNAGQSGWGFGTQRQGQQEFSAIYLFDTDGNPRWVVVASDGTVLTSNGTASLSSFKTHCPGCTWTPVTALPGGSLDRTFNADGSMTLNLLDIDVSDDDFVIDWNRSNLPMQQITPPQ